MVKQNQNCIWVGIGIEVPMGSQICREIIKANNLLVDKYRAKKGFSGSKHPHLNLYDLSVPNENIRLIAEKLKGISKTQKSFTVKIEDINYFHFGLIFLKIEKSDALVKLHEKIVEEVAKLKSGCIDADYLTPHRKYTARQKEMLMRYGNPFVLDQFQPHITIGHVKNQEDKLDKIRKRLRELISMTEIKIYNIHFVAGNEKDKLMLGKFNLISTE
ncbi:MAG: 2'-5' RNA ligase family protein [Patescibacteria group bacterium]